MVFGALIRSMNCKTIVEVGVEVGDACVALNHVAKKNNAKYFGYDMWDVHGLNSQYPQRGSKEYVESRIKDIGSDYTLTKINTIDNFDGFQESLKANCPNGIDFAFIDACHSYLGIWNDFRAIYPLINPATGIIAFHDTQRIDGCREFILDLRTKFYDGTYDVFDLPIGQGDWRAGVSFLVKRSFQNLKMPIDEACGSVNTCAEIEKREEEWYENETKAQPEDISDRPKILTENLLRKGSGRKWRG